MLQVTLLPSLLAGNQANSCYCLLPQSVPHPDGERESQRRHWAHSRLGHQQLGLPMLLGSLFHCSIQRLDLPVQFFSSCNKSSRRFPAQPGIANCWNCSIPGASTTGSSSAFPVHRQVLQAVLHLRSYLNQLVPVAEQLLLILHRRTRSPQLGKPFPSSKVKI